MRDLVLFRHGHSEEKIDDDINRYLTVHGKKGVQHTAKELQRLGLLPQKIFASPATRTTQTAEQIEKILIKPKSYTEIQPTLYHAVATDLLTFIETWQEELTAVILVGHNPGLSECARLLSKQSLPDLKAGEAYWLQWPKQDSWQAIANGIVATHVQVVKVD